MGNLFGPRSFPRSPDEFNRNPDNFLRRPPGSRFDPIFPFGGGNNMYEGPSNNFM